jgi:hypothetical protein
VIIPIVNENSVLPVESKGQPPVAINLDGPMMPKNCLESRPGARRTVQSPIVRNFPEKLPLTKVTQGYSPFLLSFAINNY